MTSPLDVLRTRLQSDFYRVPAHRPAGEGGVRPPSQSTGGGRKQSYPHAAPLRHVRENMRIITSIQHQEGWRGFFRGLGPSLVGVVPATAVKFWVYGNFKTLGAQVLETSDGPIVHAQAAVAAGIATATLTNPIWVVKTRLQLDQLATVASATRRYKNGFDCVRQILRQEGVGGLYRGLSASYLGSIETVIHLVLYERLKVLYGQAFMDSKKSNDATTSELRKWMSTSGAAGSAKLAAVLFTYPHEVITTTLSFLGANCAMG